MFKPLVLRASLTSSSLLLQNKRLRRTSYSHRVGMIVMFLEDLFSAARATPTETT